MGGVKKKKNISNKNADCYACAHSRVDGEEASTDRRRAGHDGKGVEHDGKEVGPNTQSERELST